MDCCSATFHGFLFSPPSLSLSISRGGRYCKQLLICVLLANDDPVNSQKACVVFMMNQIFVFRPVISNVRRRRDLGSLFVPFYEFCHIHNVWLRLVPVHRFCRRRGQIESRETDHGANKTYLSLSVPPPPFSVGVYVPKAQIWMRGKRAFTLVSLSGGGI